MTLRKVKRKLRLVHWLVDLIKQKESRTERDYRTFGLRTIGKTTPQFKPTRYGINDN
ncbi:hypothetical protein ES703_29851 [subsurface metagenome]